jgi:tripartite-type tricarboxylate transporter receptor subunit TctC
MKQATYRLASLAIGVVVSAQCVVAYAQEAKFPSKPISIIVPYTPGGVADTFSRMLAQGLSKRLGQPVIVENKAGANGNIGSVYVAKQAPADGYALLLGSTSTLAINPHLYKNMGYDPLKDLQAVSLTHRMPNVLVVNPATPFKDVASLVSTLKAKPGEYSYASAGNGNTMHMAAVEFTNVTKTSMTHVPYKGGPQAVNDVMSGLVPMMFHNLPAVVPYTKSGRLRAVAIADTKRSPLLPDVPTMAEAGVPGFTSLVWNGMFVRAGTPPEVVNLLAKEIREVLTSKEFRAPLEAQGFEVLSSTPEEAMDLLRKDYAAMGSQVAKAGIKID